jgi:bifunctional UDP-N-acetylglucosamine pyrophosphorylase/glucosamine-1-phosphate N-acetyltransferase
LWWAVCVFEAMTTSSAVILAAGKGTRMKSEMPKVLHRICGREMLSLVAGAAREAGLSPIVAVVSREFQPVKNALGDSVAYAVQAEQLGTGHALLQARSALEGITDSVVLVYGDVPLIRSETLRRLVSLHEGAEACITMVTSTLTTPDGLGRIVRSASGRIQAIVEEEFADEATRTIREINSGIYCFRAAWIWDNLSGLLPSPRGEIFLTDLIELAVKQGLVVESIQTSDGHETMGVNNRVQLAEAEGILRQRIREHWMLNGVTMPDPSSVYIDSTVELGRDTVVLPNTHIIGSTRIGRNCQIGPNSIVSDCLIGDRCAVLSSVVRGSTLEEDVDVGPFSHIRAGSYLEKEVHIGTSAEVKNSRLGRGSASGHFSYLGDARLGANVNIGAGTITCNYDGEKKNETVIGDNAFIGSDTMLVAPVKVGDRAATGTGSVVTKDVPDDTLVVGLPARPAPRRKKTQEQGQQP